VLVTDREQWSTEQIIPAYHSQIYIEIPFRAMKNCSYIALRPEHHWTEQKVHVHVFTCVIAYLLEQLLLLRAQRAGLTVSSTEDLFIQLAQVRRATVVQISGSSKPTVTTQIEEMDESLSQLWRALAVQN
jgi:transposase